MSGSHRKYDHDEIRRLRAAGLSIADVRERVGCSTGLVSMLARMDSFEEFHTRRQSSEELRGALAFHEASVERIRAELARREGIEVKHATT